MFGRKNDDQIKRIFDEFSEMEEKFWQLAFTDDYMGQPLTWGYRLVVGPDGVPQYQTYSNVKGLKEFKPSSALLEETNPQEVDQEGFRTPHTDTVKEGDTLRVIAELPGVEKKDVTVKATENTINLTAQKDSFKYRAQIPLDVEIDPKKIKASFKNGVLELVLKIKAESPKNEGQDVAIE